MNNVTRFILLAAVIVATFGGNAEAQRKRRKSKPTAPSTAPASAGATNAAPAAAAASAAPTAEMPRQLPADSLDYNDKTGGYNPVSMFKIHKNNIMYRMRVWRKVDLREKCNKSFQAKDGELFKFVKEAVEKRYLLPFMSDELKETLPLAKFKEGLEFIPDPVNAPTDTVKVQPRTIYLLELKEDLVFDRSRSIHVNDILSIGFILPAGTKNESQQFDLPIAYFRYKDVERAFTKYPLAKWRNTMNNAEDKTFADAFRLRLFCSRITKISKDNTADSQIIDSPDVGGDVKKGLLMSQQLEMDLVSMENELYEY